MATSQHAPITLDLSDIESLPPMDLDRSRKTLLPEASPETEAAAALLRSPLLEAENESTTVPTSSAVTTPLDTKADKPANAPLPRTRTLRPRKDIQLKPFTLENLKYTALLRSAKYDELLSSQQPLFYEEATRTKRSRESRGHSLKKEQQRRKQQQGASKKSSSASPSKKVSRRTRKAAPITARIWPSARTLTKRVSRVYGRSRRQQRRTAKTGQPVPLRRASIRPVAKKPAEHTTPTTDTQELMKESFKQLFPDLFSEGEEEDEANRNVALDAYEESDPEEEEEEEESPIVHYRLQKRKRAELNSDDEYTDVNAEDSNVDIFDYPSSPLHSLNMPTASSAYSSIKSVGDGDVDEFEIPPLIPPSMQPRRGGNVVKSLLRRDGKPKRLRKPQQPNEFVNFIVDEDEPRRQTAQRRKRPRTLKGVLPFSFAKVVKEKPRSHPHSSLQHTHNATQESQQAHDNDNDNDNDNVNNDTTRYSPPPSSPRRPLSNVDLNIFDSPQRPSAPESPEQQRRHRRSSLVTSPIRKPSSLSQKLQLSLKRLKNVRQTKLFAPESEHQKDPRSRNSIIPTTTIRRIRSSRIDSYFARPTTSRPLAQIPPNTAPKPSSSSPSRNQLHVYRVGTPKKRVKRRRVTVKNPIYVVSHRDRLMMANKWRARAPVDPQLRQRRVEEYLEDQVNNNMPILISDDDKGAANDDDDAEYEDIIDYEDILGQEEESSAPTSAPPAPTKFDFRRDLESVQPKELIPGSTLPDTMYIHKGYLVHLMDGKKLKNSAMSTTTSVTIFGKTVDMNENAAQITKKTRPLFRLAFKHLANVFDELGPLPDDAEIVTFYDFVSWLLHTWAPTLQGKEELKLVRAFFASEIECLCERLLHLANFKDRPPTDDSLRTQLLIKLLMYTLDWSFCLDRLYAPDGMEQDAWCHKELCAKRLLWMLFWMGPDEADINQEIVRMTARNALVAEAWLCLIQLYGGNSNDNNNNNNINALFDSPAWAFLGDLIIHEYGKTWEAVRIAKQWAQQLKTLMLFDSEGMVVVAC